MRSYRPAKIPNVARKICERYVRAVDDPATAKNFDRDTKYYMTGNPEYMVEKHMEGALGPLHTALLDFEADREFYDKTAYDLHWTRRRRGRRSQVPAGLEVLCQGWAL